MIRGAITDNIDVAQVVLYAFFVFFAGLVFYLRREDRREGYPLESEAAGRPKERGYLLIPTPKTFNLVGGKKVNAPRFDVDSRTLKAEKTEPWPGAPLRPLGDPMKAEIGPGAYALRADVAEKTHDGRDLIVPLRIATNFVVARDDENPIGLNVEGADGKVGGVVTDLWVDRGEAVVRYYEVKVGTKDLPGRILLPTPFARANFSRGVIHVEAVLGHQIADAPATRNPDSVTMLEEEKISAYYGAGTLYATPDRAEPLI